MILAVSLTACGGGSGSVGAADKGAPEKEGGRVDARINAGADGKSPSRSASDHRTALRYAYPSIRRFGSPAGRAEAVSITSALLRYLRAKADGRWEVACARLYPALRENLEAQGPSCGAALRALIGGEPRAARRAARIDVAAVRSDGRRAFVIYSTPGTLTADIPMIRAQGAWTVDAIQAYVLTARQAAERR